MLETVTDTQAPSATDDEVAAQSAAAGNPWTARRGPFIRWLIAAACLSAGGCPPPAPPVAPAERPPRSTDEIVDTINGNSALFDRPLYAPTAAVSATVVDTRGASHVYNLDGTILVRPPAEFRMDLRPALGDAVLQAAANTREYWAWIIPELSTYWWGRFENVGKPCSETVPLRPDQLAAVLGMRPLPTGTADEVGPMRMWGDEYDRLIYARTSSAGHRLEREYWVERQPPYMVRLVLFRDEFGRRAMSAALDDYREAWPGGPLAPHSISVIWPPRGSRPSQGRLVMRVDQWTRPERISPKAFVRPQQAPVGIAREHQVDADCDSPAATATDDEQS